MKSGACIPDLEGGSAAGSVRCWLLVCWWLWAGQLLQASVSPFADDTEWLH